MRVFLTGGTGLIGRGLVAELVARGDTPVILTRQADRTRTKAAFKGCEIVQGDPAHHGGWESAVDGCEGVINLVGHNIFGQRWSPDVKRKIRDSRVFGTEHVVQAIDRAASRPKVLVQASAIGYYGPHGDESLNEAARPPARTSWPTSAASGRTPRSRSRGSASAWRRSGPASYWPVATGRSP